jgi:hypothetical protein
VIEDIMKVSGIKEATFAKMKDFITVGSDSQNPDGDNGEDAGNETGTTTATSTVIMATTTATSTTSSTQSSNHNSGSVSIHYIQESLSDYEDTLGAFEISAGRDRISYVGSPVAFEAKSKISASLKHKKPNCLWSFGDGSSANTEKVAHIYKYPGEYNVVLNGTLDDLNSVSRTKVKVLTPVLFLKVWPDGAVEIFNKSASEINLYNWKLQAGNQTYVFPLDTIISAGKSIVFPAEYLRFSAFGQEIVLVDASNQVIAKAGSNLIVTGLEPAISVTDFERFVLVYKRLTAHQSLSSTESSDKLTTNSINKEEKDTDVPLPMAATVANVIINQTADVPASGFWHKVIHPIKTIRDAFYQ